MKHDSRFAVAVITMVEWRRRLAVSVTSRTVRTGNRSRRREWRRLVAKRVKTGETRSDSERPPPTTRRARPGVVIFSRESFALGNERFAAAIAPFSFRRLLSRARAVRYTIYCDILRSTAKRGLITARSVDRLGFRSAKIIFYR